MVLLSVAGAVLMAGVDSGIVVSVFFDTGFVSILCGVFAGVVESRFGLCIVARGLTDI